MPHTALIVPWLVFNNTGQWCLTILLITYACATHLPQRRNPYLVNFIVTTLISSIPPSLLFYTGHLYSMIPASLCLAQASLVDGGPLMYAVVQLALVFDAWSELRSLCIGKGHISRNTSVKCIALIAPYFTFGSFTFAACLAGLRNAEYNTPMHPAVKFVYCKIHGQVATNLATASGIFMIVLTAIQVVFEVWVAWIIYAYPTRVHEDPSTWRTSIHFALRVITLSMLQLVTVFLIVTSGTNNDFVKRVTEVLTSMNALATFSIVGMQKNVWHVWSRAGLRLWRFVRRGTSKDEDPDAIQPQGHPGLDWAYVPRRAFGPADG